MTDKNAVAATAAKPATRAYVTLLANDDDDGAADDRFKGVVRLAKGLRGAGSAYPLVVAVLPDVPASRRRVLADELGCVVREVQPVFPLPPHYNKLRVWEFVEYDEMMYLDAGFQGSLENIHEQFRPNGGPPPGPYVDDDMFVYKPSMATARLLLNGVGLIMKVRPLTTIADHVVMRPGTTVADDDDDMMIMPPPPTTVADHQQAASSSQQIGNNEDGLTTAQLVMVFVIAAFAVVDIYLRM